MARFLVVSLLFVSLAVYSCKLRGKEPSGADSCGREEVANSLGGRIEVLGVETGGSGAIFILKHPDAAEPIGVMAFQAGDTLVSFSRSDIKPEERKKRIEKEAVDLLLDAITGENLQGCLAQVEKYDTAKSISAVEKAVENFTRYGKTDSPVEKRKGIDTALLVVSYALILLSLLFCVATFREILNSLSEMNRRLAIAIAVSLLAGTLIRLLSPHRMTMVFMGYSLIDSAISLENLPRYGVSVSALHHLIFKIFPEDHIYILFAHSIIGAASIPLTTAVMFRLFKDGFAAVALSAFLAFTPIFVRDHNSETILVPALFWMFSAILFIQSYAAEGRTIHLIPSAANLALAILSRPEFMLLAPITIIVFAVAANIKFESKPSKIFAVFPILIPFAAVFSANLFRLNLVMEQEIALMNFEDMTSDIFHRLASILTSDNLVFHSSLFPVATVLLALASPFVNRQPLRRHSIMLLSLSLPWFAVYFVDFNYESMMRLHIPAAIFITAASAAGFSGFKERLNALLSKRSAETVILAAISAIWLASSIYTVEEVFSLTNSDEEEAFFREAIAALPDERIVFVRLGYGDAPEFYDGRDLRGGARGNTGRVHRFYPDYLLKKRGKEDLISNINKFEIEGGAGPHVYFYLGMRCYAYVGHSMHPSCARILENYDVEPVLTKEVANMGEKSNIFQWYPRVDRFMLGLYKITKKEAK